MLRGVPHQLAESVAQHSFMAAVIAFKVAQYIGADPSKAAVIALFHDIGESSIGDVPKTARQVHEAKALAERLAVAELGSDVEQLFNEYVEGKTLEAVAAKVGDLASTVLQGCNYLAFGFNVSEIITSSREELLRLLDVSGVRDRVMGALEDIGVDLMCDAKGKGRA